MGQVKVVVRFSDGRLVKGFTNDFSPGKSTFHVGTSPTERGIQIAVPKLKAVFFVKDFEGNSQYDERKEFARGLAVQGRKMEVVFSDGEVMVGAVLGYDPKRSGFFLTPADSESNNTRVFVVNTAVKQVRLI